MEKAKNALWWKIVFYLGIAFCLYFVLSTIFYWGYNLIFITAGLFMMLFAYLKLKNKTIGLEKLNKSARLILFAALILGTAFVLLIEGLIISGAARNDIEENAEYLLILGAGIRGEELSKSLEGRLEKGLQYLKLHPGTPVIVSGGQGGGESITEAEAMKRYLVSHGVPEGKIILEGRSTSTYENFLYTRELMGKKGGNATYAMVTSDFHMFRSRFLARRMGFYVYSVPATTPWYIAPNCYGREFFAVVKSFIMDRDKK